MARRRRKTLLKERERTDFSLLPALATPTAEILAQPDELFLHLCSWTVPHGGEATHYGPMLTDLGFKQDTHGNWRKEVYDGLKRPSTCFMAHLDTASSDVVNIVRYISKNVCYTDGKSILGADDRAGVAIMLHMVSKGIPGLYYLFVGEECGCIGSMAVARDNLLPHQILRAISFDRKGRDDIITHQCSRECCSREFAWALANELNAYGLAYEPNKNGLFTDSREFADTIPECTNISVGYYDQHSNKERQDLGFLAWLAEVCCKVDWEGLPTARKPEPDVWDVNIGWNRTDDEYYYGTSYGKDTYADHLRDCEEDGYNAMDELIENFMYGIPTDPLLCERIVQPRQEDTAAMIELLLDQLQREVFRPGNKESDDTD